MRTVILGATGHIGTYLVPRLVTAGHEVVAVSRGLREPYHDSEAWQSVQHEYVDRDAAERDGSFGSTIAALAPDVVVDLICFDLASATHIVGALRDRVRHFLHCGTLWVHGVPRSRPYDETAAREPFGDYGVRKAQIERYLLDAARAGFPASVLHPGHITGPGWAPVNPAGNLDFAVFDRLARGEMVALPDEGLATLQHVHADDVAQAFELAILQPDAAIGEAFHVAAREPVTMRDYADAAASWFGREANLGFLPWQQWRESVSVRAAEITRDHVLHSPDASIAKARARLGFEPRYTSVGAAREAVSYRLTM
ncbi:MAG: NAD-dependent epimerase/dehydratase family protein [Gemmatimonadota bacterium]|nr:NAD-dependent epimerase/dehydratase family protein [Gemmatimonadota bacterium]